MRGGLGGWGWQERVGDGAQVGGCRWCCGGPPSLQATPTLAPAAVLSNLLATAERNVITGNLRTAPNVLLNVRSYVR